MRTNKPACAIAAKPVRHVDHHWVGLGQRDSARVFDHADYGERILRYVPANELPANGILTRPKCTGSEFRDEYVSLALVVPVKESTGRERQVNGLKITWADPAEVFRGEFHERPRIPCNPHHLDPKVSAQRRHADDTSGLNTRKLADTIEHRFIKRGAGLQIVIGFVGQVHLGAQDAIGIKAAMSAHQADQAHRQ